MLKRLYTSFFQKDAAYPLYGDVIRLGRAPWFYEALGVPDTVDGRFDMIALHAILVLRRLRAESGREAARLAQSMTDIMFRNLDHSLREMGTGDLTVGKKVRELAENFYGRAKAYDPAIEAGDHAALAVALERNIWEDSAPDGVAEKLADYVFGAVRQLEETPLSVFSNGRTSLSQAGEKPGGQDR